MCTALYIGDFFLRLKSPSRVVFIGYIGSVVTFFREKCMYEFFKSTMYKDKLGLSVIGVLILQSVR